MRKRLAYVMLILFLFANTEAHELLKLPFLVQHFVTHNADNGLSFDEFLNEHYGKSKGTKDSEHQNLPFKTHHAVSGFLVAELHGIPEIITVSSPVENFHAARFRVEGHSPRNCPDSIWQPPKNA